MKHLAVIQTEFLKEASSSHWDYLSQDEQKAYLKKHPKSKRRITAQPEKEYSDNYEAPDDLETARKHHEDAKSGKFSAMRMTPHGRGQIMEKKRQEQMYRHHLDKLHEKHPILGEEYLKDLGSD